MVNCNAEIYSTKNPVVPRDFYFFYINSVVFYLVLEWNITATVPGPACAPITGPTG